MTVVVFRNKGEIDPRSITTFGVSSKESNTAIGFFGTGLKYAIAILLRLGCSVTIWSGNKQMSFGVKRQKIRVNDFDVITMNGKPLAFTTELGKTWEMWQAFRELYCNCKDEAGEAFDAADGFAPTSQPGTTLIVVRGEAFRDVWHSRSNIVLESEPRIKHEQVNVHNGVSNFLFYRGVRVMKLDKPSQLTYDIQRRIELTEDRTIKYPWEAWNVVTKALVEINDNFVIEHAVTAGKESAEGNLDFKGHVPNKAFLDTVSGLMKAQSTRLNATAREATRVWMMEDLHKDKSAILTDQDAARLAHCISFCTAIGFPVAEYPIIVSEFLGENVLGRAESGKIYVSKRVFMMGTKMLAGTLIEEFIHLRQGLYDETRELQNFLVDALVTIGERYTGETL